MEDDGLTVYDGAELTPERARFWLALDGWQADEAAHLLCAIDPHALNRWAALNGGTVAVSFPAHFDTLAAMLKRAGDAGALRFPAAPAAVVAWAMGKGMRLPAPLIPAGAVISGGKWTTEAARQSPTVEAPAARRARRLARLHKLGAGMRAAGTGWQVTGKRGALAELQREEQAAARPASLLGDVRRDLIAAASAELTGKATG